MTPAIVEFLAAVIPPWLALRPLRDKTKKPVRAKTLMILVYIDGLMLLWLVWRLYTLEFDTVPKPEV
jgi:hypothetical protein